VKSASFSLWAKAIAEHDKTKIHGSIRIIAIPAHRKEDLATVASSFSLIWAG